MKSIQFERYSPAYCEILKDLSIGKSDPRTKAHFRRFEPTGRDAHLRLAQKRRLHDLANISSNFEVYFSTVTIF
jgi:hypothetical protein